MKPTKRKRASRSAQVSRRYSFSSRGSVLIEPGKTNEQVVFLRNQLVTYSWNVEPVPYEDRYTVVIESEFQTNVPAPVILVDSSVLIPYLRGDDTPAVERLVRIIEQKLPFGICFQVYLEVLQGAVGERDFERLREYLGSQSIYALAGDFDSYTQAARMYFELRRKGMTVGSSADCLIALTAIENGLYLLHDDADFDRIARVFPLKIWD